MSELVGVGTTLTVDTVAEGKGFSPGLRQEVGSSGTFERTQTPKLPAEGHLYGSLHTGHHIATSYESSTFWSSRRREAEHSGSNRDPLS
jgi:hypothetical protein